MTTSVAEGTPVEVLCPSVRLVLVLGLLAAACGGTEDAVPAREGSSSSGSSSGASSGGGSSGGGSSSGGSSGASSSSGGSSGASSSGSPDAGSDASPDAAAGANAFTGAPAYAAKLGPSTAKGAHQSKFGTTNPSKKDCYGCHTFFFAGSVFKDTAATQPASMIEIRARDAAGHAVSAYSDALGNFYVTTAQAQAAGMSVPVHVGARDGATVRLMTASLNPDNQGCNDKSCHGGPQGFIHVP